MWCALGSPACKELVTLCLHNPCLTLVVRYLLEFSITPNRVFPSQWLVSCIFYNSPNSRSLLFPHCRALLLTAHGEPLWFFTVSLIKPACSTTQLSLHQFGAIGKKTAILVSKLHGVVPLAQAVQQLLICQTSLAFLLNKSWCGHYLTLWNPNHHYLGPVDSLWTNYSLLWSLQFSILSLMKTLPSDAWPFPSTLQNIWAFPELFLISQSNFFCLVFLVRWKQLCGR